jgi:hypothetical protein
MLSSFIAEEGLGIIYLFDYYWRRARKHVVVIFYFLRCNCSALGNLRGGKNRRGLSYSCDIEKLTRAESAPQCPINLSMSLAI